MCIEITISGYSMFRLPSLGIPQLFLVFSYDYPICWSSPLQSHSRVFLCDVVHFHVWILTIYCVTSIVSILHHSLPLLRHFYNACYSFFVIFMIPLTHYCAVVLILPFTFVCVGMPKKGQHTREIIGFSKVCCITVTHTYTYIHHWWVIYAFVLILLSFNQNLTQELYDAKCGNCEAVRGRTKTTAIERTMTTVLRIDNCRWNHLNWRWRYYK